MAAESIAIRAMQDKNMDLSDAGLRVKVNKSFLWALREMRRTGGVRKIGEVWDEVRGRLF
jgi:hypothetical protein